MDLREEINPQNKPEGVVGATHGGKALNVPPISEFCPAGASRNKQGDPGKKPGKLVSEKLKLGDKNKVSEKAAAKKVDKDNVSEKAASKKVDKDNVSEKAASKKVDKDNVSEKGAAKKVEKDNVSEKAASKKVDKDKVSEKAASKKVDKDKVSEKAASKKVDKGNVSEKAASKKVDKDKVSKKPDKEKVSENVAAKKVVKQKVFEKEKVSDKVKKLVVGANKSNEVLNDVVADVCKKRRRRTELPKKVAVKPTVNPTVKPVVKPAVKSAAKSVAKVNANKKSSKRKMQDSRDGSDASSGEIEIELKHILKKLKRVKEEGSEDVVSDKKGKSKKVEKPLTPSELAHLEYLNKHPTLRARAVPKSFFEVIRGSQHVEMWRFLSQIGFGSFYNIAIDEIPSRVGRVCLEHFNRENYNLTLDNGQSIHVTPSKIHDLLGLPAGGVSLFSLGMRPMEDDFVKQWIHQFHPIPLKDLRVGHIKSKLMFAEDVDFLYQVNFLTLFTNTFGKVAQQNGELCLDVVRLLREDSVISKIDWCGYIHSCLRDCEIPLAPTVPYRGPFLLLILLYFDSTKYDRVPVARTHPAIKAWNSTLMRKREHLEVEDKLLCALELHDENDGAIVFAEKQKLIKEVEQTFGVICSEKLFLESRLMTASEKYPDDPIFLVAQQKYAEIFNDPIEFGNKDTSSEDDSNGSDDEDDNGDGDKGSDGEDDNGDGDKGSDGEDDNGDGDKGSDGEDDNGDGDKGSDDADDNGSDNDNDNGHGSDDEDDGNGDNVVDSDGPVFSTHFDEPPKKKAGDLTDDAGEKDVSSSNPSFGFSKITIDCSGKEVNISPSEPVERTVDEKELEEEDSEECDIIMSTPDSLTQWFNENADLLGENADAIRDEYLYGDLFGDNSAARELLNEGPSTPDKLPSLEKRIVKPSCYMTSPYMNKKTKVVPKITKLEFMVGNSLFAMQGDKLEDIFHAQFENSFVSGVRLNLETLAPGLWVDENVIDCWGAVLNHEETFRDAESKRRHFFPTGCITESMFDGTLSTSKAKWERFSNQVKAHFSGNKDGLRLEGIDLVFFPIRSDRHFYVVVFSLTQKTSMTILDNSYGPYIDKYKPVCELLKKLFARYLRSHDHKRHDKITKLIPRVPKLKCRTNSNFQDCGIFTMLHMESYNGEAPAKWDCGLVAESGLQLDMLRRLRFKFTTKILLHEVNIYAKKMLDFAIEFDKLESGVKMSMIVDAFKNRKERDTI